VKYAARGTEQLNRDKPAEWHTKSHQWTYSHRSSDSHSTMVGNFFYIE